MSTSADDAIAECLNLAKPRSFFLYAGAGSGKTRSLVIAVKRFCSEQGRQLSLNGQKVAVITYTNAACDEIKHRLEYDGRVDVSTIHAFSWSLISGFHDDIRPWVSQRLNNELHRLTEQQQSGRRGTKAWDERQRAIASKTKRLDHLPSVRAFTYSPTGTNRGRDALNHAEVIAMTATFLRTRAGFQRLVASRFPVIIVDESQDTNKDMMDALLAMQERQKLQFSLGLFGDTMQRIYSDGKPDLSESLPDDWSRPRKAVNYRCPKRVIALINKIREDADDQQQQATEGAPEGHAMLFIVRNESDQSSTEARIAARMVEVTGDPLWCSTESVKTLTLEHHMAARRFGFDGLFSPLHRVDRLQTALLEGTLPGLAFYTKDVIPLVDALSSGDRFAAAALVRERSPLLDRSLLLDAQQEQAALLQRARTACSELLSLFAEGKEPTLRDVLVNVAGTGLFTIPDSLEPFTANGSAAAIEDDDEESGELSAWREALSTSVRQVRQYHEYVNGRAPFDTHQGVKGREFPRVRVVISDSEARGFMFSYDKLFGTKAKTKTDVENEASGKETTIERSRRLLYVTCSRAMSSLAVIYYSNEPEIVRRTAVQKRWFAESEIEVI